MFIAILLILFLLFSFVLYIVLTKYFLFNDNKDNKTDIEKDKDVLGL